MEVGIFLITGSEFIKSSMDHYEYNLGGELTRFLCFGSAGHLGFNGVLVEKYISKVKNKLRPNPGTGIRLHDMCCDNRIVPNSKVGDIYLVEKVVNGNSLNYNLTNINTSEEHVNMLKESLTDKYLDIFTVRQRDFKINEICN